MAFLEKLADRFSNEYGSRLHELAFVFPTRRARLYFLHHLQRQREAQTDLESLWAPAIFSINDFVARLSQLTVLDPLDLIFGLFAVYEKKVSHYAKEFADFYPWGKMIIADFDEIDKQLVDTASLFRQLEAFKAVDDRYPEGKPEIQKRYTGFWAELAAIYGEFNRVLKERGCAYEGMTFREAAQRIENGTIDIEWHKVVFCGFNALTRSESTIMRRLVDQGRAEMYWDMDRYFADDENQEAGHFFRQNRQVFDKGAPLWVEERLAEPRDIGIIGVQSKVSQAKVLGLEIRQMLASANGAAKDPGDTAVVMSDETLLFPVLNSLPETIERINISIGFPLQQTPVYSLLDALLEMQGRPTETDIEPTRFYHKDVQKILDHPYIKPLAADTIGKLLAKIKEENRAYVNREDLDALGEPLKNLFKICPDHKTLIASFLELLDVIRTFDSEEGALFSLDHEYIYHFYTLLSRLQDSLASVRLDPDMPTLQRLFGEIVSASRIPFTGEPLEGLQIMGILETQTLDFENLFVLSLNEGHLPPGKSQQSFIPFEIRAAVGLPTYRERDAIFAYHFYRLLKNSRNITLLYTTEARGIEKSEKSRFIDQVLLEFAEKNPQARISHRVIDFSFDTQKAKEIAVEKSANIIEKLSQRSYSASSLLTYLACPLKFYLSYILKLREEEAVLESPDQRLLGTIIHETLNRLYRPLCKTGRAVSYQDIDRIAAGMEAVLGETYREELASGDITTGRSRIAFEVMKEYLNHFFEKEKQEAGFEIVMLEEKIENVTLPFAVNGREFVVNLEGHIDRLDIGRDGLFRIIDYKTGKIGSLNLESVEESADHREAFQLFFYRSLLKSRLDDDSQPYRLGIYPFKRIYEELQFVTVAKSDIISQDLVTAFEGVLVKIFQQLFDEDTPFTQTRDEEQCRYCPYVNICTRTPAEQYA